MDDDDGNVIPLFPDDDGGATLARSADRLAPYLDERVASSAGAGLAAAPG